MFLGPGKNQYQQPSMDAPGRNKQAMSLTSRIDPVGLVSLKADLHACRFNAVAIIVPKKHLVSRVLHFEHKCL